MKKFILLSVILSAMSIMAFASDDNPFVNGIKLSLETHIINPTIGGSIRPRDTILPPDVYLEDHTIYIDCEHDGLSVTLYDEYGANIYETYLMSGVNTLVFPASLCGEYFIELADDEYAYEGKIELE